MALVLPPTRIKVNSSITLCHAARREVTRSTEGERCYIKRAKQAHTTTAWSTKKTRPEQRSFHSARGRWAGT